MSRRLLLAVTLFLTACNCGVETLGKRGSTTLTIDSPTQGETFAPSDKIDFHATGKNLAGLKLVALSVGRKSVKTCPVGDDPANLECDFSFTGTDLAGELTNGQLVLTAIAHDAQDTATQQQITINVRSLRIRFIVPRPDQAMPIEVSGTSGLSVGVVSASPLQRVGVTYDDGQPQTGNVILWPASAGKTTAGSTEIMFTQSEMWTKIGTGIHHLTAHVTDTTGQTDSAKIDVKVLCSVDSDCASGLRCCPNFGTCNPIVAANADCDCEHPCPLDQGCFPGTCGATPRKCRPGCFPGDETHVAEKCDLQDNHIAYCSQLPPDESTVQNQGGACAVSDDCDILKQDCPDLPLDRTKPVSANNPAVPHTCSPAAPHANVCIPAGSMPVSATGCNDGCGLTANACGRGLECTTPINANGQATGPSECNEQCTDPISVNATFPTQSKYCPRGQYCAPVEGWGREPYQTGVCQPM